MQADIQNVKDAICSAVDVMQAMAASICLLLTKVILLIFEFSSLLIGVEALQIWSILVLFTQFKWMRTTNEVQMVFPQAFLLIKY